MTYYAFRNTSLKGVYKDPNVYKEIINLFPDASYRQFRKKEEKEKALEWAGVKKITKTKEFLVKKQQLGLVSNKEEKNEIEEEFYKLNEHLQLKFIKECDYIPRESDSYDSSIFLNEELNKLSGEYEIYKDNEPTNVKVIFFHDLDMMAFIDSLIIPKKSQVAFNKRYKEYFIDSTKKEQVYIPFELRTMHCNFCWGKGCMECY